MSGSIHDPEIVRQLLFAIGRINVVLTEIQAARELQAQARRELAEQVRILSEKLQARGGHYFG